KASAGRTSSPSPARTWPSRTSATSLRERPAARRSTFCWVWPRRATSPPSMPWELSEGRRRVAFSLGPCGRESTTPRRLPPAPLPSRAARALGGAGGVRALEALIEAAHSTSLARRHAAVLFLAQIGGPKAEANLKDAIEKDPARLVRAAAADALKQVGTKDA